MLTWLSLLFLALFSTAAFMLGKRRAVTNSGGVARVLHSLPGYYGSYAALWAGAPAALLLLLGAMFGGRVEDAMLQAQRPAIVRTLDRLPGSQPGRGLDRRPAVRLLGRGRPDHHRHRASRWSGKLRFFQSVPSPSFLFGTKWSPQIAIRADQVGSSKAPSEPCRCSPAPS
jgi:hypothetical protein